MSAKKKNLIRHIKTKYNLQMQIKPNEKQANKTILLIHLLELFQ